jgi:hypothetical protein
MPRQPLMVNPMRRIPYPAPGEILLQEFLKPMNFTQYRLAKEFGVPQRRVGSRHGTHGARRNHGQPIACAQRPAAAQRLASSHSSGLPLAVVGSRPN